MDIRYDVVTIDCGETGIPVDYELTHCNLGLKVVILDQGANIYTWSCPIVAGKTKECIHCKMYGTMCGFDRADVLSDGKYNLTTALDGWLTDFMSKREVMELIDYADSTNMRHGATDQMFSIETPATQAPEEKTLEYDLHLFQARRKHPSIESSLEILQSIYEEVCQGVELRFRTAVTKIENLGKEGYHLITNKGDEVDRTWLVAGPGRSGAEWLSNQYKELGIQLINNQADIGVRMELPARVLEHITDVVYGFKLVYHTKQYGDQVHTFCMNPHGHMVAENMEGISTVNGHSYSGPKLRNEDTNFALLVSNRLISPLNEPYHHGKHIASLSNVLAGGILVQRFGDLVSDIRTNEYHMSKSFVRPTLTAAMPGDLFLALPKWQLDDIIEIVYQLDKLAPDTTNYDTLFYGAEVKFYSARLALFNELETASPGFFAVGDGAGVTRGLVQVGASGVKVTQVISEWLK